MFIMTRQDRGRVGLEYDMHMVCSVTVVQIMCDLVMNKLCVTVITNCFTAKSARARASAQRNALV